MGVFPLRLENAMKLHRMCCGRFMLYDLRRSWPGAFQRRNKRLFRFLFLLALLLPISSPLAAADDPAAYLLKEGFEGPGFANSGWFKNGAPAEDYTAQPLHGPEALYCSHV